MNAPIHTSASNENKYRMFDNATNFNGDISGWDVGRVTDIARMFQDAESFNVDISGWDMSKTTSIRRMFSRAIAHPLTLISLDGMLVRLPRSQGHLMVQVPSTRTCVIGVITLWPRHSLFLQMCSACFGIQPASSRLILT